MTAPLSQFFANKGFLFCNIDYYTENKNSFNSINNWLLPIIILAHSAAGFVANILSNLWDENLPHIKLVISLASIHDFQIANKLKLGESSIEEMFDLY
jgi:hypothetical protein